MDPLALVDGYCDAVPRGDARVEEHGPLRLFVPQRVGHPWYARPAAADVAVSEADVHRVCGRQRALGLPEALAWVGGRPAGLERVVRAAGLAVQEYPLLVVTAHELRDVAPVDADVRLLGAGDDLARVEAVVRVAAYAGADPTVGVEALDSAQDRDARSVAVRTAHVLEGRPAVAAAYVGGEPVARAAGRLVGDVAELTGVATLPALRGRGLGGAVTRLLAAHAFDRGAELVFLSAHSEAVVRVYARLGFVRVGSSWLAGPHH